MSANLKFAIRRVTFIFILLAATIGCDQSTKVLARDVLPSFGVLKYAGGTVQLEHAQNPGAFMSFGANLDSATRFWFFSVITGIFLTAVAVVLFRRRDLSTPLIVAMTLILGGGLGNLIDRLLFGSVTDFMIVGIGPLRTGIFNFADTAVVAGTAMLIIYQHTKKRAPSKTEP